MQHLAARKVPYKNTFLEKLLLKYGLYLAMLVIIAIFAFTNKNYLTVKNILNIFEQSSYYLVCCIGMTFVLLTGEFDLSIGGNLAFFSVVTSEIMIKTRSVFIGIVAILALAIIIGLINGFCVVLIKIPAFIATIATGYITRSLVGYYTNGETITGMPTSLTRFAWNKIMGIPILIWFGLAALIIAIYLLNFTKYGRKVFACGGNKKAANVVGINTKFVLMSVFVISALCAAVGAIMVVSRSGVARYGTEPNLQMQCIAAAVIGGTSLFGGHGSITGTFFGVALLSMITSGLNALGVGSFWQQIFTGSIIICAAILDSYKTRNNM